MKPTIDYIKNYLMQLQDDICAALETEDSVATFTEDTWEHANGGGGRTRALANGKIFEKAGVNFSHVYGEQMPAAATATRPELANCKFQAMGLSLVIHPENPMVPTSHANIRFFVADTESGEQVWWFGGGYDLTPYYGFDEDCIHWHQVAKAACDPFGPEVYNEYKTWCDEYFYLKHRDEPRGIGGLFFDDLNQWDFETCFAFMRSVGDSYLGAYLPIVARRKNLDYTPEQKAFQLYRRGRYVEFNLVYDRGTLFGLQNGGRIESILMSLPAHVSWEYQRVEVEGSREAQLYARYLVPQDWAALPLP